MSTILFSLCWLGDSARVERYERWLRYQRKHRATLAWDKIVLVDNCSPIHGGLMQFERPMSVTEAEHDATLPGKYSLAIFRYNTHIPRTGIWEYPYCWRGLEFAQRMVMANPQVDKIIFLDADFYVTSERFARHIRELDTGWESVWCEQYGFPEAALHILCKDSFHLLLDFPIPSYTHYNGQHMEWLLPFTHVERERWKGGRYGERADTQPLDADYYGQWAPNCPEIVFHNAPDIL